MNQISIITDLIKWIEGHLEQSLSIDNVALKSGYSKWHLQRMFKKVTGQVLGSYIRHRRLTHAALALRITSRPILEIAMQYQFDSQQTFTRSFKKQFNITPASYRRHELWELKGLTPPIRLDNSALPFPEPTFIRLPQQLFWGVTYKNNSNLEQILNQNAMLRQQFVHNYFSQHYLKTTYQLPERFYAFQRIKRVRGQIDEQEIYYTVTLEEKLDIEGTEQHIMPGGQFLCFKFIGLLEKLPEFITQIYLAALPMLQVKLTRSSIVMEVHHNNQKIKTADMLQGATTIECDYYIEVAELNKAI